MDEKLRYERICACALGTVFGYEPRYAVALMSEFGSAADVFGSVLREEDHGDGVMLPLKYRGKINHDTLENARRQLERLEELGCGCMAWSETSYPPMLKECPDAPALLYVRSDTPPDELFAGRDIIAIVGTRDISPYGREWTRRTVEALALCTNTPAIASGLAFGVDICAHLAALDCGLPTIAVLPCGIDSVYPISHREAAARIASSPGSALITDYPPDTAPAQHTFVRRNRIIAGLARATLVMESKKKGGSLITARHALDYSREVYALPGRIDDFRSAGCNSLIRSQTAQIITSPEDLAGSLGLNVLKGFPAGRTGCVNHRFEESKNEFESPYPDTGRIGAGNIEELVTQRYGQQSLETRVAEAIRSHRGITAEDIASLLHEPFPEVLQAASMLEADGLITTDLLRRCFISPGHL